MENENLSELEFKNAVWLLCEKFFPGIQAHKREVDFFHSDGYGEIRYRSWFFCVKGSPNKLCGFTQRTSEKDDQCPWIIHTDKGRFFYNRGKVSKRFFVMPYRNLPLAE